MSDSARYVFDHAPLGAIIRYSDGAPRPPERHRKKLQDWKRRNGQGRLERKSPGRVQGRNVSLDGFVLHEGECRSEGVVVLTVHVHHAVDSALTFEIAAVPPAGSVLCLTAFGDEWELAKVAPDRLAARRWAEFRFASRLRLEEIQPDGSTMEIGFVEAAA